MAIPAMMSRDGLGRYCKFAMRDAKDILLSVRYLYVWGRRDSDKSRIGDVKFMVTRLDRGAIKQKRWLCGSWWWWV
jgi:hypothetical protein